jgi:hypothetical protein
MFIFLFMEIIQKRRTGMKKLILGLVCACVLGSAVNVFAGCGGCGTKVAKKEEAKKLDSSKKGCIRGGCGMAKLNLSEDQKTKVKAAKAEFMKKLEGILTPEQMKTLKANCPCGKGKDAKKAKGCCSSKGKKCGK